MSVSGLQICGTTLTWTQDPVSVSTIKVEGPTTRVSVLERHLRQAEGAVVIDLDVDRGGKLRDPSSVCA